MFLKTLFLRNFRNYERKEVELQEGINLVQGENGRGKTNLLEAIYYLGHLMSFRTSSARDLIRWEADYFFLRGEVYHGELLSKRRPESPDEARRDPGEPPARKRVLLETGLGQTGRKMKVNGTEVRNGSSYLGGLEAVVFFPDSLFLVKGLPQERRSFLDRGIFALNRSYQKLVQQYYRVLQRKNTLLKTRAAERSALEVWNDQLADLGSQILWERLKFVGRLNETLAGELDARSGGGTFRAGWLQVFYASFVLTGLSSGLGGESALLEVKDVEDLRSLLSGKIQERKNEEIQRGLSLIGPHRDDLVLRLRGKDLKRFGSQGEQRFSLLLVILAMVYDFKKEKGFYPVLLLDDLISELDRGRKKQALDYFPEGDFQAVLTSTEEIPHRSFPFQVHRLDMDEKRVLSF